MSDSEVIELVGLGRPFQLGMLYDCRRDALIPGITLWDSEVLKKNINVKPQPNTDFKIFSSQSSEAKSSALNVTASLEASFLGGLVSVKGSAEFLNSKKKSKHHSQVTLQYKTITRFEQLTMDHLGAGNIKHYNVFTEGSATHVVTGILYGAQAFFVFDKEISSNENHQEIEGSLYACIKKIPQVSIEGQASLKMTEGEKQESDKFNCTFHGDFALDRNPVTFLDAINVYSELPKLLGVNGERAVPMSVWLYPLKKFDSTAAMLVREISVSLVRRARHVIDSLDDTDMQCQELMNDDMANVFTEIKAKLRKFKDMCSEYKLVFQKQLCKLLPSIRGGGTEEQELVTLLTSVERSPFQGALISAYMNDRENEMNVLRSYLNRMRDIPVFSSSNNLIKDILKSANDYVVVFAFTSLDEQDSLFSDMEKFLKETSENHGRIISYEPSSPKAQQWFSGDVATKTLQSVRLFVDFRVANHGRENVAFCIASIPNKGSVASSVHVYDKCSLLSSQYELPSKPPVPTIMSAEHDCIHLEINKPAHGINNVESYIILYQTVQSSEWIKVNTESNSTQVTIKDLEPNKEYRFSCQAVCCPGVSLSSDATQYYKTRPCSPPGPPKMKCTESNEITITWDIPKSIGEQTEVIDYLIEYTQDKKGKPWVSTNSTKRECTLKTLKNDTPYTIRVSANCQNAGMSLPGVETTVDPSKKSKKSSPETRSQLFLEQSYVMGKGNPTVHVLKFQCRYSQNEGVNYCVFGHKVEAAKNKVVLLLGATGSGKTTLINAMINYILGVKWEENYRFKLINEMTHRSQAESQTSDVTSYELYNQPGFQVPYSLTIVDTPGFGDTRGIEHDKQITEQIKNFLCNPLGIQHIDAVCFVIQASLARLSATQRYIFDSILSIFGKDIAENIMIMVTFAHGTDIPALEAIRAAEVPCQKKKNGLPTHFSFNNSALYAQNVTEDYSSNDSDDEDTHSVTTKQNEMTWGSNFKKMRSFFRALEDIESKDLKLTIQVLEERERLAKSMQALTSQIKAGLSKCAEIASKKKMLKIENEKMKENENFEQEVEEVKASRSPVNCFTVNCNKCFFTCHSSCFLPEEDAISTCAVFDDESKCVMCPGNCHHSNHLKEKVMWTYETIKKKQTIKELMDNFNKAKTVFMSTQDMLDALDKEYKDIYSRLMDLVKMSFNCLRRLDEIALRPRFLSAKEYFDLLIKTEQDEKKPGFEERIVNLQKMKEESENLNKIAEGEHILY
ncbi:uncharacterized protein LOC143475598 [Brachyhypopomus gauderio]|uniref:uncharacterized protein LOC143475598 n=1 Tax=Brachyhypopomus gauderio TaxID=698409 RepID=UPI004042039E